MPVAVQAKELHVLAGPSTINAVVRPVTAGRPAHIAGVDGKSYVPSYRNGANP